MPAAKVSQKHRSMAPGRGRSSIILERNLLQVRISPDLKKYISFVYASPVTDSTPGSGVRDYAPVLLIEQKLNSYY